MLKCPRKTCLLLSFLDNSATKPLDRTRVGMALSEGRRWVRYGGVVVEINKYMEEAFAARERSYKYGNRKARRYY